MFEVTNLRKKITSGVISRRLWVRFPFSQHNKPTKLYYNTGSYLWVRGDGQKRLTNYADVPVDAYIIYACSGKFKTLVRIQPSVRECIQ